MATEGGAVVLIVDDEERILSALRRTLRREGYEILTAESPEEALRLLAAHPVEAVVSDQRMPGMTGLELLARVAAQYPDAARLLITGWTERIPSEELEKHGVQAIIPKPWDDAALKQTLRESLARR